MVVRKKHRHKSFVQIESCLVCGLDTFNTIYESSFPGSATEALHYFSTHRRKAVHGKIVRCDTCGFTFTNPQFPPIDYHRIYQRVSAKQPFSKDSRARFSLLKEKVKRYKDFGSIIDYGCGDGLFLSLAGPDFSGIGIEISPDDEASIIEDQRIVRGSLENIFHENGVLGDAHFDIATAWDFFEHVPEIEDYVRSIHHRLKDDGLLMCTLPNIESRPARIFKGKWNLLLIEHLWYFSPRTFIRFIEKFGFQVIHVSPISYPVDVGTMARRLDQTYGIPLDRLLPRLIQRLVVNLPIGNMFVVCRKL